MQKFPLLALFVVCAYLVSPVFAVGTAVYSISPESTVKIIYEKTGILPVDYISGKSVNYIFNSVGLTMNYPSSSLDFRMPVYDSSDLETVYGVKNDKCDPLINLLLGGPFSMTWNSDGTVIFNWIARLNSKIVLLRIDPFWDNSPVIAKSFSASDGNIIYYDTQ
jgi:hypothetical protein